MELRELNRNELIEIDGGIIPLVVVWGIVKVVAATAAVGYGASYAIGKAHAHYDNNNE